MTQPVPFAEVWRADLLESVHNGHAVICNAAGEIVESWGDPKAVIYPRSSAKMLQALPLLTSGAAAQAGLSSEQMALACASHSGALIHTDRVAAWLSDLGLSDRDLRCGPQPPDDLPARNALIKSDSSPCQWHNYCSGKHAGFLTLSQHLGAGSEYIDPDHPVQLACKEAFETATQEDSPGFGIDGCSAPNFSTTVHGLARAMAGFASAGARDDTLSRAAVKLTDAMMAHPELVAGEGRACTRLMRALGGAGAVKTGAEGVFVAILPRAQLGIALKVTDGATRASECAITALLVRVGALAADDPVVQQLMTPPLMNRRDINCGQIRPAAGLLS